MTESQNAASTLLKLLLLLDLQNGGDEFYHRPCRYRGSFFIFNPEIECFIKISQFYFHKNNQKVWGRYFEILVVTHDSWRSSISCSSPDAVSSYVWNQFASESTSCSYFVHFYLVDKIYNFQEYSALWISSDHPSQKNFLIERALMCNLDSTLFRSYPL